MALPLFFPKISFFAKISRGTEILSKDTSMLIEKLRCGVDLQTHCRFLVSNRLIHAPSTRSFLRKHMNQQSIAKRPFVRSCTYFYLPLSLFCTLTRHFPLYVFTTIDFPYQLLTALSSVQDGCCPSSPKLCYLLSVPERNAAALDLSGHPVHRGIWYNLSPVGPLSCSFFASVHLIVVYLFYDMSVYFVIS